MNGIIQTAQKGRNGAVETIPRDKLKSYDGFRTTMYGLCLRLEKSCGEAAIRQGLQLTPVELGEAFAVLRGVLRMCGSWGEFQGLILHETECMDTEVKDLVKWAVKMLRFIWEASPDSERRIAMQSALKDHIQKPLQYSESIQADDIMLAFYGDLLIRSVGTDLTPSLLLESVTSVTLMYDVPTAAELALSWMVSSGISTLQNPFTSLAASSSRCIEAATAALNFFQDQEDSPSLPAPSHASVLTSGPSTPSPPPSTRPYRTVSL